MTKTKIILLSIPIIVFIIGGGGYLYSKRNNTSQPPSGQNLQEQEENDQEEDAINELKENLSKENDTDTKDNKNSGNSGELKSVKPEITFHGVYQGNVEVSSGVPGIFEKSGKCILSLKNNNKTVTQNRNAVPNVSEMSCGLIKIPVSKLSPGTWYATVTYSSSKAQGSSSEVSIEVK